LLRINYIPFIDYCFTKLHLGFILNVYNNSKIFYSKGDYNEKK